MTDIEVRCELLSQKAKFPSPTPKPKPSRATRQFDPSKYSTRYIALKFAYLGQRYNGLEYHTNNKTPYPTVEEELWKALYRAKLVFPSPNASLREDEPNWEGCEYSKAGRTDKGVSAYGQVIGIRVRSNRPVTSSQAGAGNEEGNGAGAEMDQSLTSERSPPDEADFDPINHEIPYPQILNRLLPPQIRILAWCPSPPADFSARFSCKERSYKYFFTQPAFAPSPGLGGLSRDRDSQSYRREGWLDIHAMRAAAKKLEGLHDFRNFCKVDASKQIHNFERRINKAEIVEVKPNEGGPMSVLGMSDFQQYHQPETADGRRSPNIFPSTSTPSFPNIYAYKVQGSAFLWHQVRHMVAILFLVGQGLEGPSLIDSLLDISQTPQKPVYDMADAEPLVLEDCKFPGSDLQWVYLGDYTGFEHGITRTGSKGNGKYGLGGSLDELWKVWHKHKIDETLAGSLLGFAAQGPETKATEGNPQQDLSRSNPQSQKVHLGGSAPRLVGKYVPVLQRPRMESVASINANYLMRKGFQPEERHSAKDTVE